MARGAIDTFRVPLLSEHMEEGTLIMKFEDEQKLKKAATSHQKKS